MEVVKSLSRAVVAMSALISSAAFADEIVTQNKIDIGVRGNITQQCSLGSIGDMDFGDLERRGLGAEARVAFNCNLPFVMTIKGLNGGLAHSLLPTGQGPYGGTVPYTLDVQIPVRYPSAQTINRSFDSRQLRSGGTVSSNGGIAVDGMLLTVALGTPSGEAGLLAGEYSETITITVTPS
jgi:spore coat protein U-like protein